MDGDETANAPKDAFKKTLWTHYSLMNTIFVTRAAPARWGRTPERIINKLGPPSRKTAIG